MLEDVMDLVTWCEFKQLGLPEEKLIKAYLQEFPYHMLDDVQYAEEKMDGKLGW